MTWFVSFELGDVSIGLEFQQISSILFTFSEWQVGNTNDPEMRFLLQAWSVLFELRG